MRKVVTVEETFQIKGRGLVIVGKTKKDAATVKIGDFVTIILPNNHEIKARISGIPMFSPPNFKLTSLEFSDLTKDDISVNSEIFVS